MKVKETKPEVKIEEKKAETKDEEKKVEAKTEEKKETKDEEKKVEAKTEEKKETKDEEKKVEAKTEEKKETKKEEKKIVKKDEAVAKSTLSTSLKHCMAISDYIKGKKIDTAINELKEVADFKRVIPMKGEIPHRKGDIMAGRYPIKASGMIINMLKALKGNVIANGMDLDKSRIVFASASWASRPQRRGGVKAKRCNMILKAREVQEKPREAKK